MRCTPTHWYKEMYGSLDRGFKSLANVCVMLDAFDYSGSVIGTHDITLFDL